MQDNASHHRSVENDPDSHLDHGVSFIVFTFNSSSLIEKTLEAIVLMPKTNISTEILLVDNNSSDDTIEKAESLLSGNSVPYKVIRQPKQGLFYSRVAGIEAAKYRYFVFVDDDNILQGDWATRLCELMQQNKETWLVGGVNESILEKEEPVWWEDQKHAFAVGKSNPQTGIVTKTYYALWGAGLSGRTSRVKLLYGNAKFWLVGRTANRLLAGEDSELCYWAKLVGGQLFQSQMRLKHVIVKRKLNKEYVLGIHTGFRLSDHYLLQYRIALSGKMWFWQNMRYGIFLIIKWLIYPLRILACRNEVEKLNIRTKTPTFTEAIYYWKHIFLWRAVFSEIQLKAESIRRSTH